MHVHSKKVDMFNLGRLEEKVGVPVLVLFLQLLFKRNWAQEEKAFSVSIYQQLHLVVLLSLCGVDDFYQMAREITGRPACH